MNTWIITKTIRLQQISRTRKEALSGRFLPEDFRFGSNSNRGIASSRDKIFLSTADVGVDGKQHSHRPSRVEQYRSWEEGVGCEPDRVMEQISSEKVIAGTQMKINLFLANEKYVIFNENKILFFF